jgi:hypothetical protein
VGELEHVRDQLSGILCYLNGMPEAGIVEMLRELRGNQ